MAKYTLTVKWTQLDWENEKTYTFDSKKEATEFWGYEKKSLRIWGATEYEGTITRN